MKKGSLIIERGKYGPIAVGNLRDGKDFCVWVSLKPSIDIRFDILGIAADNDFTFH